MGLGLKGTSVPNSKTQWVCVFCRSLAFLIFSHPRAIDLGPSPGPRTAGGTACLAATLAALVPPLAADLPGTTDQRLAVRWPSPGRSVTENGTTRKGQVVNSKADIPPWEVPT